MDLSRRKCIIFATNFSVTMETRSYKYISNINSPIDLKAVSREELPQVCDELRQFIIDEVSKNPGHLGSSLGVVELTVALHYVFNTPYDRIVWDVGHQAYGHKILTGRRDQFHTNRQFGGLCCNDEIALFDSIEHDAVQAQLAQVLELFIVQSYDNIHAQMALMQQNEQAMDVIQRDIDRQSKYAEIKAKQMQDKFDACIGETRSFDAVLNDANRFLSADLNKLEQKADDNMPKLSKMRMWF
jgi:hypothetical protein